MNDFRDDGQPDEGPPPWFTNQEDLEPEPQSGSIRRWLIAIGAVIVITILLLIPILQSEILQRRRESLPDNSMERTALLFASAILFGRSEGQAMLFTQDESSGEVRSVLRVVMDSPQPSNRARLQIASTPCGRRDGDACFTGQIFDPAQPIHRGIRFGIDQTDEDPIVIWVELDEIVV